MYIDVGDEAILQVPVFLESDKDQSCVDYNGGNAKESGVDEARVVLFVVGKVYVDDTECEGGKGANDKEWSDHGYKVHGNLRF